MKERINKLRQQSTETKPSISAERALLVTEFYKTKEAQEVSIPVKRAGVPGNRTIYDQLA